LGDISYDSSKVKFAALNVKQVWCIPLNRPVHATTELHVVILKSYCNEWCEV